MDTEAADDIPFLAPEDVEELASPPPIPFWMTVENWIEEVLQENNQ